MTEFLWPVRIYYEDTDSGGVVYYANYLKFMERARTEWLRHKGLEQDQLRRDEDILFTVRSAQLDFLLPGHFNDRLEVTVKVANTGKASFTFEQNVVRDKDILCSGKVRVACLDVNSLRPKPLPSKMLSEILSDN